MDNNSIPADRGTYGAFMELHEKSEHAVHDILKAAANDLSKQHRRYSFVAENSDEGAKQRIGALYTAMMDEKTIEALHVTPLWEMLDKMSDISDNTKYLKMTGRLRRYLCVGAGRSLSKTSCCPKYRTSYPECPRAG